MAKRPLFPLTAADGAFILALGLLAATALWSVHYPAYAEINALRDRLADQRRTRQRLDALNLSIERTRSTTERLETRLASYADRILFAPDRSEFFKTLSDLQERCGVTVEQIVPAHAQRAGRFEAKPVEIMLRGRFPATLCFLHRLKGEMWSADLKELRIETKPAAQTCLTAVQVQFYVEPESDSASDTSSADGAADAGV